MKKRFRSHYRIGNSAQAKLSNSGVWGISAKVNIRTGAVSANEAGECTFKSGEQDPENISLQFEIAGPGHITGLQKKNDRPIAFTRLVPEPGIGNFPPNQFVTVESEVPSLLWELTPRAPHEGKLPPTFALLVLKADELKPEHGTKGIQPSSELQPLESILVSSDALPDLEHSWMNAAAYGPTPADLSKPPPTHSVLISTRHLEAYQKYTAYVVPAFERGRLAGLGLKVNEEEPEAIDMYAWK